MVVEIETLAVMEGGTDRASLQEALDWARANKDELVRKWNEYNP